jgi:transposase-like protein
MRRMHPQPSEAPVAPEICPFCNSREIKTTSKTVTAASYWRCTSCDQIWNASRLSPQWRRPTRRFN